MFNNIFPTNLIGWITAIVAVVGAFIYLFSRIRATDMRLLRETNEDQEKRIKFLETSLKRVEAEIDLLLKKNKTMEDLVVTALKQYFFENPKIAEKMQKAII